MNTDKLYIVGAGPGAEEYLVSAAKSIIDKCDVLIGGQRNLEAFKTMGKEMVSIEGGLDEVCSFVKGNLGKKIMAVIVSGDPGIYSMSSYLRRQLPEANAEIIPGISSLQYLCAKAGCSWEDADIISVHGRSFEQLLHTLKKSKKLIVFTDGGNSPAQVCREMLKMGITDATVTVGEYLSYPQERIVSATVSQIAEMEFPGLSIMLIQDINTQINTSPDFPVPGIPDHMFMRGDAPMTKEEVRVVSISKLRLSHDSTVIDIGAGTGSVAIECSLICQQGFVYAVERNAEAIGLIHKNIDKFGVNNIKVVEGLAPQALEGLPRVDRVFIGGSGGSIKEIIGWVSQKCPGARVVVNAITLESVVECTERFEAMGFVDIEVVNVAISRAVKAGNKHMMRALNPVYIISANIKGERTGE